jgi:hypothetical protein
MERATVGEIQSVRKEMSAVIEMGRVSEETKGSHAHLSELPINPSTHPGG